MLLRAALLLACSAAAAAQGCSATPDDPSLVRYGEDFLSAPLPPHATFADCVALCCQTSTCLALSFNSPQPETTKVGGTSCLAGGVCCMLKRGVPALGPNPNPGAVRSAALALGRGAAPAPPFPPSTAVAGAVVASTRTVWNGAPGAGDTWPSVWTADGRTLAWVCDTALGPMGLTELSGDPYAGNLSVTVIAGDPIDWPQLCAPYNASAKRPDAGNVKSGGVAEVGGTLFLGATCIDYGWNSTLFVRQRDIVGFVAASEDAGKTWANVTAVGAFPGRFSAPTFTNCGRGSPCRDPLMNVSWTYVFFTGSGYDDYAYWENGDAHYLARVAPDAESVANPAAYQYWAGYSGGAAPRPQWSPDATQAQPVLAFGRMLGQNALHYNAEVGRWLVANYGFVNAAGNPWPWHQSPWHELGVERHTQLVMLEAPEPWGPWSVFYRDDDFGAAWNGTGGYGTTFPAAFHRPLQPDGRADMIMLFSCGNGASGCVYKLNYVNVSLQLTQEGIAHAAAVRHAARAAAPR